MLTMEPQLEPAIRLQGYLPQFREEPELQTTSASRPTVL